MRFDFDRFERRRVLRRGAGRGALSADVLRAETQVRAVAARRVRVGLRRGQLVVLRHPRWADVGGFLDDLSVELDVSDVPLPCQRVDLSDSRLRRTPGAWGRLLAILAEQTGAPLPSAAAWPMAPEGFRFGVQAVLEAATDQRPRVLLAERGHHLPADVLSDLALGWSTWAAGQAGPPNVRLLLAVRAGVHATMPEGCTVVDLPDPTNYEAVVQLAGWLGTDRVTALQGVIAATGELPELLRQIVLAGDLPDPTKSEQVLRAWGGVRRGVIAAVQIARSDDNLARRLDRLAEGPRPFDAETDVTLEVAGLVRRRRRGLNVEAQLRSPTLALLGDTPDTEG